MILRHAAKNFVSIRDLFQSHDLIECGGDRFFHESALKGIRRGEIKSRLTSHWSDTKKPRYKARQNREKAVFQGMERVGGQRNGIGLAQSQIVKNCNATFMSHLSIGDADIWRDHFSMIDMTKTGGVPAEMPDYMRENKLCGTWGNIAPERRMVIQLDGSVSRVSRRDERGNGLRIIDSSVAE